MSLSLTAQRSEIGRLHQNFLRQVGNSAVQGVFSRRIKQLTEVYLRSGGSIKDLSFLITETVAAPNLAEERARMVREGRRGTDIEKTDFKVDIVQLAAKKLADRIEREQKVKAGTSNEVVRIVEVGSGGEQISTS